MFPKFALADKEFEEGDNEVCLFAHGLGPKVDVAEENDVSAMEREIEIDGDERTDGKASAVARPANPEYWLEVPFGR